MCIHCLRWKQCLLFLDSDKQLIERLSFNLVLNWDRVVSTVPFPQVIHVCLPSLTLIS